VAPTFIGYFLKRTVKRPDWLKNAGVEEICSVSSCISTVPDDGIDQWRHNELWVYDTEEIAWNVVPPEARHQFDLYAYFMFPVRFDGGREEPYELPPLNVQPLPSSFVRLGYDAVSRSTGNNFECSPLSCNYMAEHVPVNRYCLVDTEQEAFELAREFSAGNCEPGPYYVVEVWKRVNAS
jgi:hypothetical protein